MNINMFFGIIIVFLVAILFLFKPLDFNKNIANDLALIELEDIKVTEIDQKGLSNIMIGSSARKYIDRYVISDLDYMDNANKYLTNIRAKVATYKDDILDLEKDIIYSREDGLSFQMEKASYIKNKNIVKSPVDFVAHMNDHKAVGSSFEYNNEEKFIKAKNVFATYILQESEK